MKNSRPPTNMQTGTLYIVSTPIGNLEDMTLRAIRVLKEVDLIAAEDTRKSQILLKTYDINTPVTSYYSYNLDKKTPYLLSVLLGGKSLALVSDSGTPGISDPGYVLIARCIEQNIPITVVPGPTALIAALVLSGKATKSFVFEGFLSNKSGRRRKQLEALKSEERTVILYESPHRIIRFLEDFIKVFGDREIVLAREITKKFEEVLRATAGKHLEHFAKEKPRGEFIVIF